jgi:hypothetical protein
MSILKWIKKNKVFVLLLVVLAYFLARDFILTTSRSVYSPSKLRTLDAGRGGISNMEVGVPAPDSAPAPDVDDRMVVKTSQISAVVKDVSGAVDQVVAQVEDKGGYMVSSSISRPEESPYAQLVVRVPVDQLETTMKFVNDLSVKVTSQNLQGRDVTDQYEDLEEKLRVLNETKAKFESILDQAEEVDDILNVQRELINLQDRIDRIKGRQEYLEKTAENARLTIHLSSDELSLPYVPQDDVFRPEVVFKKAVRSLVRTLRGFGRAAIWFGVYSLVLVPVLGVIIYIRKRRKNGS